MLLSNFTVIVRLMTCLNSDALIAHKSVYMYVLPHCSDPPKGHPRMNVGIIDSIRSATTLSDLETSAIDPVSLKTISNYVYPAKWSFRLRFTLKAFIPI